MITNITYGMRAYRPRQTSTGLYFDAYRVSEMTGRKLELITVVPEYVWDKPNSPSYNSYQLPAADLIDEQQFEAMKQSNQLHPAMKLLPALAPAGV